MQCPYCQLNTGGQHEWGCPMRVGESADYIMVDGVLYQRVYGMKRLSPLHPGAIHIHTDFDAPLKIDDDTTL